MSIIEKNPATCHVTALVKSLKVLSIAMVSLLDFSLRMAIPEQG